MGIDKIKCDSTEIEVKINECCNYLGMSCIKNLDNGKLMQFKISRNGSMGILRVYITKKGIKFDDSQFKDKSLYNEFEECIKNSLDKTQNRKYSFKKISDEAFKTILAEINNLCDDEIVINFRENKDSNKTHFFEVKNNKTGEKILITKYKNGTLMLDGVDWLLWTDICNIVDKEINSTPLDIFDRFLETKEIEFKEIDSKYRTNNYSSEEASLKHILTDTVFMYLNEHFRNYLISAQRLIESEIMLPEYSPILCPLAKVLEGYLKRLLVDLKVETYENMECISEGQSGVKWNFGNVFNGVKCIRANKCGNINDIQEKELINIYSNVIDFRHNQNHGSLNVTKQYNDRNKCIEKYDEIIELIKISYYNTYK
ncbi:hypothetical protein [Clostridium algidicarnis]|uniref:hypothetical protein n=1 Tax=Clostridium algidicarnis TaxID=37659 RepID=UPI003FD7C3C2